MLREEQWVSSPDLGFAFTRAGAVAEYFGPCIATSTENARRFVEWLLEANGGRSIYWDLLPQNQDAVSLAAEYGFRPIRRLVRMRLGNDLPPANPNAYYALSGFEYG